MKKFIIKVFMPIVVCLLCLQTAFYMLCLPGSVSRGELLHQGRTQVCKTINKNIICETKNY